MYVAIATFDHGLPISWDYLLRLLLVSGILILAWRWYIPFKGPKSAGGSIGYGMIFGLIGTVIWILMVAPFVKSNAVSWDGLSFSLRLLASFTVVPIFEELLIRGYVFRLAHQWHMLRRSGNRNALAHALDSSCINDIAAGVWSVPAVLISTLAFTLGHHMHEWPASFFYGLTYELRIYRKKRFDFLYGCTCHY